MKKEQTTSSKKITIGFILSWIFWIFFGLTGIIALFSDPIPGIVMLIMAAVLIPSINKLVDKKWNFHLSNGMKIAVIFGGFIIFGATIDTSDISNTQQVEKQIIINNDNTTEKEKEKETVTTNQVEKTIPKTNEEKNNTIETEIIISDNTEQNTTITNNESELTPEQEPTASITVSQKNAIKSAKAYLDYSAFSHDGLIKQLEYEQFSHDDAVYGVDSLMTNRNEQSAKAAKDYLDYSAFSRGSLIEQLKYEGFTQTQAEYGANAVGL